ncbi:hypothetical protein [Oscillibacter sp.]|uniref:hypothetical protein n=1 Tax=Oscillibacter sp. TaxID=1945593 RepID=UPI00289F9B6A|nr:hypothetical protein [Oscillibacter sp.]
MKGQLPDKPCYGCTERAVGCHGSCAEYQEADRKRIEARKAAHRESRALEDYTEVKKSAIWRTIRKVRHRKG